MKKMKKTLCALSAFIISLTNAMSVSAVYEPEIIDGGSVSIDDVNTLMTEGTFRKSTTSYAIDAGDEFLFKMSYDEEKESRMAIDNAVFTSSALVTDETAGDYEQLVIDENYNLYKIGSRNNYVYYKLADGVKYSETPSAHADDDRSMCTEAEPSCHGTIMEECVDSLCGALYGIDGIDPVNDDLYCTMTYLIHRLKRKNTAVSLLIQARRNMRIMLRSLLLYAIQSLIIILSAIPANAHMAYQMKSLFSLWSLKMNQRQRALMLRAQGYLLKTLIIHIRKEREFTSS